MPDMFDDDNAARRALRQLGEEAGPPLVTRLDDVVRRGRRRMLVQRVGTVAAVVAVVAGIGVGAVLLRSGDLSGGVRVGDPPTSAPTSAPPVPTWRKVGLPRDVTVLADGYCRAGSNEERMASPDGQPVLSLTTLQQALIGATRSAAVPMVDSDVSVMIGGPEGPVAGEDVVPRASAWVAVPTKKGTGRLLLEASLYGGTPEQAADAAIVEYGNCEPPYRRVMADGTVLQLYPVYVDPQQPTQSIHIYRPDGQLYRLVSVGAVDLPVDQRQFRAVAEQLVANLG